MSLPVEVVMILSKHIHSRLPSGRVIDYYYITLNQCWTRHFPVSNCRIRIPNEKFKEMMQVG